MRHLAFSRVSATAPWTMEEVMVLFLIRIRRASRADPGGIKRKVRIHGFAAHGGSACAGSRRVLLIYRMNLHGVGHAGFARAGFLQHDVCAR